MTPKVKTKYEFIPLDPVKTSQLDYMDLLNAISPIVDAISTDNGTWVGFGIGQGLARVGANTATKFCDNCSSMDVENYHKCLECVLSSCYYELYFDCYNDGHGVGVKIHNMRQPSHLRWILQGSEHANRDIPCIFC